MDATAKAGLVDRLRRIQSVGGSLLSNATAALKAAEAIPVDEAPEPPTPDPEPVPDPEPTPVEPPAPVSYGVPAGVALTAAAGRTITAPGTILDSLDVTGRVTVDVGDGNTATIRRCKVHGDAYFGIRVVSGTALIEDVEIFDVENGISGGDYTARRCDIHHFTGDGAKVSSGATVEDSWIHDPNPAPGAHADGIQGSGSSKGVVIRRNLISMPPTATSCIMLKNDVGSTPVSPGPVLIEGNRLNGGGYTLYAVPGGSGNVIENVTIRGNTFGPDKRWGYTSVGMPVTWADNVTLGGEPINL